MLRARVLLLGVILVSSLFAFGDPVREQLKSQEIAIAENSVAVSTLKKTVKAQTKQLEEQQELIIELKMNLGMYADQLSDMYKDLYRIEQKVDKVEKVKYKLIREE